MTDPIDAWAADMERERRMTEPTPLSAREALRFLSDRYYHAVENDGEDNAERFHVIERALDAARATVPDADLYAVHNARWACSEDRDACDPAVNPHFHAAQLASIGRPSATASSGSGSTSDSDGPSGSRSRGSSVPDADDRGRLAALIRAVRMILDTDYDGTVKEWVSLDSAIRGYEAGASPSTGDDHGDL